jgi:hypothetical protein
MLQQDKKKSEGSEQGTLSGGDASKNKPQAAQTEGAESAGREKEVVVFKEVELSGQSTPPEFEKIFSRFLEKLEKVINDKDVLAFVSGHKVTNNVVEELKKRIQNSPKTKESFDEINNWLKKQFDRASAEKNGLMGMFGSNPFVEKAKSVCFAKEFNQERILEALAKDVLAAQEKLRQESQKLEEERREIQTKKQKNKLEKKSALQDKEKESTLQLRQRELELKERELAFKEKELQMQQQELERNQEKEKEAEDVDAKIEKALAKRDENYAIILEEKTKEIKLGMQQVLLKILQDPQSTLSVDARNLITGQLGEKFQKENEYGGNNLPMLTLPPKGQGFFSQTQSKNEKLDSKTIENFKKILGENKSQIVLKLVELLNSSSSLIEQTLIRLVIFQQMQLRNTHSTEQIIGNIQAEIKDNESAQSCMEELLTKFPELNSSENDISLSKYELHQQTGVIYAVYKSLAIDETASVYFKHLNFNQEYNFLGKKEKLSEKEQDRFKVLKDSEGGKYTNAPIDDYLSSIIKTMNSLGRPRSLNK